MASELKRNQFGMSSKGQVVVIEKQEYDDHGSKLVSFFEVRHGVRTIGEFDHEKTANAVAEALMKERSFVEAEPEPVVEPEPAVVVPRSRGGGGGSGGRHDEAVTDNGHWWSSF